MSILCGDTILLFILTREVQPSKTLDDISFKEFGNVTDSKELQFSKAPYAMEVTDSGIMIDCNEQQPDNNHPSTSVIDEGILIERRDLHFWNAEEPIFFTDSGI